MHVWRVCRLFRGVLYSVRLLALFTTLSVVGVLIVLWIFCDVTTWGQNRRNDGQGIPNHYQKGPTLQVVGPGFNIQVGELEVHVMSAIHRNDYPTSGAFNVMLVGWADSNSSNHNFVCCLGKNRRVEDIVQIPAKELFLDKRLPVLMRFALFSCSAQSAENFRYVAFAEKSCDVNMTIGREIAAPKDGTGKFAMCIKIAFGNLDPCRLIEWFELAKIVGVDVVQVFYHSLNEEAVRVFRYYEKMGFAIVAPVFPAVMKGHPVRSFIPPRWEEQAWMDGAVICNDCVHRLSQYDFVVIMDFDELLVPSPSFNSLFQVLQAAADTYPQAAAFFIETFIAVTNWPAANNDSAIFFLRYLDRSVDDKVDNSGRGRSSPKIIFRPLRVTTVSTHDLKPAFNYTKEHLPKSSHMFLHYRECKSSWDQCDMLRVTDISLLRFEPQWLKALGQLPLEEIGCNVQYAARIRQADKRMP